MTTTIKLPTIPTRTVNRVKRQWDKLQGRGNRIDYDRAKLLHEVWGRLQKNDKSLAHFIVTRLGEYKGKHTLAYVRMVHAYDKIDDVETWTKLGGKQAVLLSRVKSKAKQKKILSRVNKTLKRTGRSTVTRSTFREIAKDLLTPKEYDACLVEPSGRRNVSLELSLLKQFLLTLVSEMPELEDKMPKPVRAALGLDIVGRQVG